MWTDTKQPASTTQAGSRTHLIGVLMWQKKVGGFNIGVDVLVLVDVLEDVELKERTEGRQKGSPKKWAISN